MSAIIQKAITVASSHCSKQSLSLQYSGSDASEVEPILDSG